MNGEELPDSAVPVPLLAHALRTPLNLVEGYAGLLASGGIGRLDADARAAVADLHVAARTLTRTLGLLDHVVHGVTPPPAGAPPRDLGPALDLAAGTFGWRLDGAAAGPVEAVGWDGWQPLLHVAMAALDERGAVELVLDVRCGAGDHGAIELTAAPFATGSGDTALADWLLQRISAEAGLQLRRAGPGQLAWQGRLGLSAGARRRWAR